MIPTKPRRVKTLKLSKNLERAYKQSKCHDCTVMVTRMDFAKILGKFTKVKIQFETSSSPKAKRNVGSSPGSRLKNNENGTVLVHRSAYNPHPAKKLLGLGKKTKNDTPRQSPNILKENNRIKKTVAKEKANNAIKANIAKHYKIVFVNPVNKKLDVKSKINLDNLLPSIDKDILPSHEWNIDYFPKKGEPKDDKIYDRIAAELEDLMYNEKTKTSSDNKDGKNDEFPSILDILNDTSKSEANKLSSQGSVNLESSDVEAMLLGKSNISSEPTTMEVDKPNTLSAGSIDNSDAKDKVVKTLDDNPNSPSILEEPEQAEVPVLSLADKPLIASPKKDLQADQSQSDVNDNTNTKNKNNIKSGVTQVIFKKIINGTSSKMVICPKNLKYSISIQGKSIELLGAPKVITSLEDLKVLLQIVEESELTSLYLLQ